MAESIARREFLIAALAGAGGLWLAALAGGRKDTADQAGAVFSGEAQEQEVKDSDYAEAVRRVKEGGQLKVELIGVPTYVYRGNGGGSGSIRSDYLAFICTTKWGLKLMSPEQVETFRKAFPTAE